MYHRQKIAFKYIPTQFSHGKHTFYMKIDPKSIKNEKIVQKKEFNAPAWGLVKLMVFML